MSVMATTQCSWLGFGPELPFVGCVFNTVDVVFTRTVFCFSDVKVCVPHFNLKPERVSLSCRRVFLVSSTCFVSIIKGRFYPCAAAFFPQHALLQMRLIWDTEQIKSASLCHSHDSSFEMLSIILFLSSELQISFGIWKLLLSASLLSALAYSKHEY